jgi:hypothetical protein
MKKTISIPATESSGVFFLKKGSLARRGVSDRKSAGLIIHRKTTMDESFITVVSLSPAGTRGGVARQTASTTTQAI